MDHKVQAYSSMAADLANIVKPILVAELVVDVPVGMKTDIKMVPNVLVGELIIVVV